MRYSSIALGVCWIGLVAVYAITRFVLRMPADDGSAWPLIIAANCCGCPFMFRLGRGSL